jgi:hypothetical protein
MQKRTMILLAASVLIIGVAVVLFLVLRPNRIKYDSPCNRGQTGECLPAGQCMGGTDGIVDCETGKDITDQVITQ